MAPLLRLLQVYKPFQSIHQIHQFHSSCASTTSPLLLLSTFHLSSRDLIDIREKMSSGDWMCGSCQHLNFKKRDSCQRCRFPKFGGDPDMSSYGINRTEVLAGDWYCNVVNCGAHNYASRTSCYRCGASKEDYYGYGDAMMGSGGYAYDNTAHPGWKTGDWICNRLGCGEHNYASRTECYKCKAPREYGGSV